MAQPDYQFPVPTQTDIVDADVVPVASVTTVYLVRDVNSRYVFATSPADGSPQAYLVTDGAGRRSLNDASAGALDLVYFSIPNRITL